MCFARKRVSDYGSPMKLRLLSWNVHGANNSSKRKVIKAMIRNQRVDLFCIQETKIQSMSKDVVRILGSGRFLDWGAMGAHGSAGGILICWDKRTLEVLEMEVGQFSISCRLRNVEDGLVFTGVYMSFSKEEREVLWEELGAIRGIWDDLWCLGGDFNVTLSLRERSNQGRLIGAMRRLPIPTSDHFPILLKGGGLRQGPSLFMFENMWLKVDGFKDLLRGWWQGLGGRGRASFRLATKMKQLLLKEPGWRADIEGLHLQCLNLNEAKVLELPFTEEEIHFALVEMNGDKAPGLNGFTMAIFIRNLLPKVSILPSWSSFQRKVLGKVVFVDQNSFVRGRQILDVSLITNEVLHKMGFGSRWMEWIWWCISIAKFSVLVNGVPAGYFSNSKGLRQGDPLSPYLFVLGMEVLSVLIRRAVDGGFISGCSLRGRGGMEMNVSRLLFTDDTIIFYKARKEHLTSLSWILAWFEAASGLRINLAKSELILVREVEDIEEMAVELGCRVGSLPIVYLGLPLGAHHKASSMWDGVEERMRRRLALWKRQYMSKGGRITLIKRFKVGEGIKVKFWTDQWCSNEALSQNFPQLFALAVHRNATVNEVWDSSLGQGGWNLRFSKDSNDWELDAIGELFHMLRDFRISSEEDSMLWKGGVMVLFGLGMLISCWLLLVPSPSRKNAFGWIRFQPKLLFLLAKPRGRRSSLWIGSKNGGGTFLIVAFCVAVKRKM
ncbi:putative mitochondrial protein [Vitis vinifera]|uniref:Putative mitochondrial protein n=1 Tax=Vitis vinifera TaxID=29760 RepID=A0A438JVZ7_VITVI|nr:putative mitochondrial protein [Vitis vinifera]